MFIGHYAVAFAAKRAAPRTSLGALFAAAQLPDLVWPLFVLLGVERVQVTPGDTAFSSLAFTHYPWSHSLLAVVVWALAAALVFNSLAHDRAGAVAVGTLVVSHWVLDYVTHYVDLPLYPGGSARVGLGLWDWPTATVLVETAMFAVGLWLYLSTTDPRDRIGRYSLWALAVLLFAVYVSDALGPPPASPSAVAWFALAGWLLPLWAAWTDRHRLPRRGDDRP